MISKKTITILVIILLLNSSRYLTYLLEGNDSIYYLTMFILNVLGLLAVLLKLFFKRKSRNDIVK